MSLQKRTGRVALGGIVAVGAAVSIAACGGSSSGGSGSGGGTGSHGSGSPASASEILARAADSPAASQGYTMSMVLHETVDGKHITVLGAGSATPSKHEADIGMTMGGSALSSVGTLKMRVILSKKTLYMKLPQALASKVPGGKPWVSIDLAGIGKLAHIPGYSSLANSSSTMSNPGQYLDYLRAVSSGSVKQIGHATIAGVQTTGYHATIDLAKLPAAVPAADRKAARQLVAVLEQRSNLREMPVSVWLDGAHRIRRVSFAYSVTIATGQTITAAMVETIHHYGPQPSPALPSAGQTTNLLKLMQSSGSTSAS